ncbi:HNH/endonuclease VII fold putative polymorphic toxin [Oligoflexus tunisiensis]|uniref:HNH/endonuclease VII fold putative polymorphic toxin n=1 Tax=Oligoflexus tunisiensis TaxID=708132 RepID=UPI000A55EABF|nr:HNH/endonuclease VII fold putative polymorphic toxin [Oligoflexus tunisiensis]
MYRIFFALFACLLVTVTGTAQDKSGARSGLVKLPEAGGTVGSEGGSFSVSSNKGASQYRLPLPELPVRSGFGPSVELTYNQFTGDRGQGFGIGWSLSVPSIEVSLELGIPLAGEMESGELRNYLTLQGQKLIFIRRDIGGLIYRMEASEEEVLVTFHRHPYAIAHANDGASIPSGFEILFGNGRRQIFSGDPAVAESNGAVTTRYPLVADVAPWGETIHYTYIKDEGRSYLQEISFAGGASRYRFELFDGLGHLTSYMMGYPQQSRKLYSKLVASHGDAVHAQWCFAYVGRNSTDRVDFAVRAHQDCAAQAAKDLFPKINNDSLSVLDELRAIYRYGNDIELKSSTDRLPSMYFQYSSWTEDSLVNRDLVYPIPQLISESGFSVENYELADVNHDGLVDALRRNSNGTSDVFHATGDLKQPFASSTFWTLKRGSVQVSPDLSSPAFHFADLNGDSYVDLLQLNVNGDQSAIYLGQANGHFEWTSQLVRLTQDNSLGPVSFERGRAQFQDINADGLTDILTTAFDAAGSTVWKVYLNTSVKNGNRWNFRFLPKTFRFPFSRSTMTLADPNFRLLDVNGDQLPDVIYLSDSPEADKSGLCLYINNGQLYSNGPDKLLFGSDAESNPRCGEGGRFLDLQGLKGQPNLFGLWLIDVNGDGIMDVTTLGEDNHELLVWLGFGDQTLADLPLKLQLNLPLKVSAGIDTSRSRVADIDGDGQMEILLFDAGADAKSKAVMIDFNRQADRQLIKSNLMTTVAFESGLRYDIRYATSTTERLRDQRLGRAVSSLHFPVVLAKQVVISQGVPSLARNSVEVQEFFYHRPFYDADDREFLGFSEVEVLRYGDNYAEESSLTRESYYTYADDRAARKLAGKLKSKEVLRVADEEKYREKATQSNRFDPNDPVTHSWLEESQRQSLPPVRQLVSRESHVWETVPQADGWVFLRLTEQSSQRNGDEEGEATASPYTRKLVYEDFDAYNLPHLIRETIGSIKAPFQQHLPEVVTETSLDYEDSRRKLKSRGIVDRPDYQLVQRGGEILSYQRYVYEDRGLVEQEIDFVQSRLSGDIPGFAGERLSEYERTVTYGHDAFGNRTSIRDHFGLVESVEFDPQGVFAMRRTLPKASPVAEDLIWKFDYEKGRLDHFTSPLGLNIQIEYDNLGRRIRFLGSDGSEQRYAYKLGLQGEPTLIKTSVRRYVEALQPDAGETRWIERMEAYRPDGQLIASVEDATAVAVAGSPAKTGIRVKEFAAYDRNKRKIFTWTPYTIFDGAPSVATVFANAEAIPTPVDQIGVRTRYDFLGRVSRETFPSGLEVAYEYAPWGQVARQSYKRRNQDIQVATYLIQHDLGLYAQVEEDKKSGEAHVTRFERNGRGQLEAIYLPGESAPRRLVYDNRGLLEKQEIPGLGTTYQLYDQRDRLVASVRLDKNEKTQRIVENIYDQQDRLTTQILDGSLAHSNSYDVYADGYTPDAQHGAVKKPLGLLTSTRSYDVAHKLFDFEEKLAYNSSGEIVHRQVKLGKDIYQESYQYLVDGSIKGVKNPMGLEGFYASDAAGALRAVKIRLPGSQQIESIMDSISYNAKGQIDEILYRPFQGSYSATRLSYDPRTLLLQKIQSSFHDGKARQPLQDLTMGIDGHAHILSIEDGIQDSALGLVNRTARFDYNWKGELIESQRFQRTLHYDYSPMGSFVRNDEQGPGTITAHPDNAMIPQGPEGQTYKFNDFGELQSSPRVIATGYNALGQLVFVETAQTKSYFGYNAAGDRVYKRVVEKANSALRESFYPMRSMAVEPKGSQSYIFVGESRLVRLEDRTGEWYYYLKDHLGSSDIMMHASGQPVEQMLYQPYGTEEKPETLAPAWAEQTGKVASIAPREKTHHRFTGHYLDDDSGLYYMKARYYDPQLGRFIQPDPLFMAQPSLCQARVRECNLYGYAQNNPLKYTDPTGTIIETVWDIANVAMDVASLAGNVASGNWAGAAVDAAGLAADVAATVVPGVPGGAGTAIKAARAADKAADALKAAKRAEGAADAAKSAKRLEKAADKAPVGRSGALNEAKRDLGIPRSQHPDSVTRERMTNRDGSTILNENKQPIMTREYTYTKPDGSKVVIQDHSAGHKFGEGGVGDQGPHFNVRPPENTRTGSVPGTKEHYNFKD